MLCEGVFFLEYIFGGRIWFVGVGDYSEGYWENVGGFDSCWGEFFYLLRRSISW